jgi:CTP:molybdopterin cytidylyltransferase MocA
MTSRDGADTFDDVNGALVTAGQLPCVTYATFDVIRVFQRVTGRTLVVSCYKEHTSGLPVSSTRDLLTCSK